MIEVSVIVPTHNPNPSRLRQTLLGLRKQNLSTAEREIILVDNASTVFPDARFFRDCEPEGLLIVREATLGLTSARRRGFHEAKGNILVLVDDDNVLSPSYLQQVRMLFAVYPGLGAAGGKVLPDFERPPLAWEREFLPLLALRDLGDAEIIAPAKALQTGITYDYPTCAPIGAGMALRHSAVQNWLKSAASTTDRRGSELSSGGDNDIVLSLLQGGWDVGYFPELSLTHLIPAGRLDPKYLARLNRGIQKSWMQVLRRHSACPWPSLTRWSASIRKTKAWFTHRAWSSPSAHVRWQGACGHFEGRVA